MLLQALGPVTVTGDNGAQVQLRPRERALLSVLLLHAGQPCQTGMLADSVWGQKQPRHPEEAVRLHMGRMRKALESQGLPPIVMKVHRAYRIDPPAGSLDLHRFRSGRLPDLPDTPRLMAIAVQLAAQRHKAETWLTSLQVDLGRHEELIPVPGRGGDADACCLAQR